MVYHLPAKDYEVYEVHPAKGVEIVMVPKGAGNLESLAGVHEMLDAGYQLICYCPSKKKAEVSRLSQKAKDFFIECFERQEVLHWRTAPVRQLVIF